MLPAVLAVEGVAFALLAGLDGSVTWQAARVLLVVVVTAWAVWLTRRARRVGQGATALALGIAGTAAGAGAASAHLAKAGPDAAAAAAVVVLVTGVVLLAWGAATLIRATPGWWRLLAVPMAMAVLWFVLLPLTVAVNATNRPPGPLGPVTPARYGLGYKDVAFRTVDGVRLSAWYIPPRNGAAVVLLPGAGSTRTAVLGQAAVLARHGYGALLVDTRGHGRSGGHAMDFGWWGERDVAAAVSFLDRQAGVRVGKIAALGDPWAASRPWPRPVPIPGSAPWSPRARPASNSPTTAGCRAHRGALQRGMEWVIPAAGLISGAPRPMSIPDAVRAAGGRPTLIIVGGAVADESAAARWFRAPSPATVQVWVVPHAGHTQGLTTAPRAWEAHVIGFLDAALERPPITPCSSATTW